VTDRELLHWIVDQIDEGKLDDARIAIGGLMDDPLTRNLMTAPLDDEPLSAAERRAIEKDRTNDKWYSDEEVAEMLKNADRRLVG
jgi:hypothetical protein